MQINQIAILFVSVIFMMLSLIVSIKLLNWAIDYRFSKSANLTNSNVTADYREKQLNCLARNIYFEAGNQPFEGKVAVAQVTINRSEHEGFPGDICQVVYQKNKVYDKILCQFSWYCDRSTGTKPLNNETYIESMVVAKKVLLEGFRLPSLEKALYFHADYVKPNWNKEKVAKIGQHIFYK